MLLFAPPPPTRNNVLPPIIPVTGLHNVERLICSFLSLDASPASNREILVSAPGSLPVLKQLFIHQLPDYHRRAKIELRHITPLIKASGQSGLMLNNIEILSAVLPFTISQTFHYEVYCFYRKELLLDSPQYAFPYYMVFNGGVILLSSDGHTALPLMEQESISYFRNLFFASRKKASPLISTCICPAEILEVMLEADMTARPLRTLEYQPCFAAFITESMVQKYIQPDIMNRGELTRALLLRVRQLASMERPSCIFSKDGLLDLAVDGTISDFPAEYILPIDITDRIQLLKALYLSCKEDRQFLRLVNPVTLSLPRHLSFIIRDEHSIDFGGYTSYGTSFNYVHITEPGILESFEDFYDYLSKSSLVCTKEETLEEIESLIVSLSDKAYPLDRG